MAIGPWSGEPLIIPELASERSAMLRCSVTCSAGSEHRAVANALAFQPDVKLSLQYARPRLTRLQLLGHLPCGFAIGEVARQQQLFAIGRQQTEAETAVVLAEADKTRGFRGFFLGGRRNLVWATKERRPTASRSR